MLSETSKCIRYNSNVAFIFAEKVTQGAFDILSRSIAVPGCTRLREEISYEPLCSVATGYLVAIPPFFLKSGHCFYCHKVMVLLSFVYLCPLQKKEFITKNSVDSAKSTSFWLLFISLQHHSLIYCSASSPFPSLALRSSRTIMYVDFCCIAMLLLQALHKTAESLRLLLQKWAHRLF